MKSNGNYLHLGTGPIDPCSSFAESRRCVVVVCVRQSTDDDVGGRVSHPLTNDDDVKGGGERMCKRDAEVGESGGEGGVNGKKWRLLQ